MGNRQPVESGQQGGEKGAVVLNRETQERGSERGKAQEHKGKWEKCLRKSTAQQRFECGNCCKDSANEMAINLSQMSAGGCGDERQARQGKVQSEDVTGWPGGRPNQPVRQRELRT